MDNEKLEYHNGSFYLLGFVPLLLSLTVNEQEKHINGKVNLLVKEAYHLGLDFR
jgi:hypothetical protein